MHPIFGWTVLVLVFVDELLAMIAFGVWGWQHDPGWLLVVVLPVGAMTVWWCFASPKAPRGGAVARPVVKLVVFGLATAALWDAGHEDAAIAFLAFSVVINALAILPSIRALTEQ